MHGGTYLADAEPTLVAGPAVQPAAVLPHRWEQTLSEELTAGLQALAREHGLTLNTVVQGLWAVLLGRLTGRDDVVFGVTVAGRPAEIAGIEQMVGLFINTVPVRVRLRPEQSLGDAAGGACSRASRSCWVTSTSGWPRSSGR